jgi:rare lipoprotein A
VIKISLSLFALNILIGTSCATPPLRSASYSSLPEPTPKGDLMSLIQSEEFSFFRQEGLASWYGPGFYGHKTASGSRFKKDAYTCAHRTLPFGTRLVVKNLETGKSVEVIVNDRGPYVAPRILDLSYVAAREIGVVKTGVAKVEIKEITQKYARLSGSDLPENFSAFSE